jgi:hypothetical protein
MTVLAPKRSTEAVLYSFDFTKQLAPADDTIQSFTLTRTAGTVTLSNEVNTDTAVRALISGGANGETATMLLTVNTVGGQVLKRDLSLYISDTATAVTNSTTTKGQIEDMAFEEIGLAGYEFDATAEEQASGLRRLDSLMAMWAGPGMSLDLGYNFPHTIGTSDRADASGIPDFALDAVVITLAESIMPAIGKSMSTETRVRKQTSMNAVRAACAVIPERQLPASTLRGAGRKPSSTWAPYNGSGNGGV